MKARGMALFLLTFLTLYGAMQFYVFWKIRLAFPRQGALLVSVGAFLVLMLVAPVAIVILERRGFLWAARIAALIGHTWMAITLWFCCLAGVTDLWNLAVRTAALRNARIGRLLLAPRQALSLFAVVIAAACVWGLIEAWNIRVKEITARLPRLGQGCPPIRIVQVSDLHLGLIVRESRLRRIVEIIERSKPDLLVSTGDMVDASMEQLDGCASLLGRLNPRFGKFAVLGNHDFYVGTEHSLQFHKAAGFRVLSQDSVIVDGRLRIAGVGPERVGTGAGAEAPVLPTRQGREATILLRHQPVIEDRLRGSFDLQLSGHTHGGQVFPFGVVSWLVYGFRPGLHRLDDGTFLYVSRGTGTWGPPMRLFSPPEVALITVRP